MRLEVVAKPRQPARGELALGELRRQRTNGVAVDLDRVEEPRLLLELVGELLHLLQVLAHQAHPRGERRDRGEHARALEVAQHLVPVADRAHVVKGGVEAGLEGVLLATARHRLEHLVEVEVVEVVGLVEAVDVAGALEEDALEARRRRLRAPCCWWRRACVASFHRSVLDR